TDKINHLTLVPIGDHKVTTPLFHTSEFYSKVPLSYHNRANRVQCTQECLPTLQRDLKGASCIVTQVLPPGHNSIHWSELLT
ncbi:hypothetical protein L195_g019977, partial [Trifolium pratense]